ncbi:transglutaminase domain-containing protein [Reichenbachiella carrageenanivorans]|uniref:Transglutaminase domain-containing protein n=1 Tax=Reichenbachiella carrageenanivorans TaxID=2979869 RepID=A0ABY6CX50_9BACT|nr:transglutaminase domain-containing protein [Reichenbachiella carrageenanivorans]UXX77955.1 transglutaminase domain-containing protein [Reichenbachiella carrageenanivorans]
MKIPALILSFFCVFHLSIGQTLQYQIEIDHHRTGAFRQSTEHSGYTHTFSSLDLEILTLDDTLSYHTQTHFVESDAGLLSSISWTQFFRDTLRFDVTFLHDSLSFVSPDGLLTQQATWPNLIGPDKIKCMSTVLLDSIGASFCYHTYSTELNQPIKVTRELIDFSIEKAQKYWLVKETINDTKTTLQKYDKQFRLIEARSPSPFGEIKMTLVSNPSFAQFFNTTTFTPHQLRSNVRLPDPKRIQKIRVDVQGLDSINYSSAFYPNQSISKADSSWYRISIRQTSQPVLDVDTAYLTSTAFLWSHGQAKALVDSLTVDSLSRSQNLKRLVHYARTNDYPHLALIALTQALGIPARLVYGYAYAQWFWTAKTWVELVIDDNWKSYDLTSDTPLNPALQIVLYRSQPGQNIHQAYLESMPKLKDIQVQNFLLGDKKYAVSHQILPFYYENPVYENEGLGLRFNIPDGFSITADGTDRPSPVFLALTNEYDEKITFSQELATSKSQCEAEAKAKISTYLEAPEVPLNYDKKLKRWYGFSKQRGAMAILQGSSFIFVRIMHQDPDFMMLILTRKNLHIKY